MAGPALARSTGEPVKRWSRRHLVTGGVLAVGWSIAVAVYLTSTPVAEDYDVYDLEHSKKYLRQVEMIGGKAGVFANDLSEWLAGLFRGPSLAFTVAFLTAVVALACHLAQRPRPSQDP